MGAKCQKIHLKRAYTFCQASVAFMIKINGIFAIYFSTVEATTIRYVIVYIISDKVCSTSCAVCEHVVMCVKMLL